MTLLDTGYLVAMLDVKDELHARAIRWSRQLSDDVVVTSDVLVETANYFAGRPGRRAIASLWDQLRRSPQCVIVHTDKELLDSALGLYEEMQDKQWSLTDCISFTLMRQRGITRALAYDHHFEQAGFQALLRMEPTGS